jgi:outer membrane protein assembly factor BamB
VSEQDGVYREAPVLPELDRSVLVVGLNGRVFGLERTSGAVRWVFQLDIGGLGSYEVFLAIRYGVVVASSWGDQIVVLDYQTGALRWAAKTTSPGRATILLETDVVICAKSGYLDCFDHYGQRLWSQPLTGYGGGGTALGFPGNIAQADEPGR